MNVLSVCSGVAGLELGLRLVVPTARTVGYVEGEAYAAAVLATRMEEGYLGPAPIHSDAKTFCARAWCGSVDLVASGFPCQPFSVAGTQKAEDDPRHLWPHIARIIRECDPTLVFLENVNIRAYREPWRDLRGMGFNLSRPFACTAAELGAPIVRARVFAIAHRRGVREQPWWRGGANWENSAFTFKPWREEPAVSRSSDGIPNRLDRNGTLGNAVVPAMAAFAFNTLIQEVT